MSLAFVMASQRKLDGFSLIELMVTLVILVVMTLIAVPGMSELFNDARLSTQADLLASTMNSARLEAVKQRKDMKVCPLANPDADTACSSTATDWGHGFGVWDGAAIIQRVQAKGNVTLTTTATSVVFRGTLGSSTAAASFTLCITGRKEQEVDVALSGHVSKKTNALCS